MPLFGATITRGDKGTTTGRRFALSVERHQKKSIFVISALETLALPSDLTFFKEL